MLSPSIPVKVCQIVNSFFHCASTGHKFLFEHTKILAREPNNFRRRVIEGIHIYNKRDSCVNLIAGLEIDKSWSPILKELVLR